MASGSGGGAVRHADAQGLDLLSALDCQSQVIAGMRASTQRSSIREEASRPEPATAACGRPTRNLTSLGPNLTSLGPTERMRYQGPEQRLPETAKALRQSPTRC